MRLRFLVAFIGLVCLLASDARNLCQGQEFPVSLSNTNVGYIDPASIGTRLRVRFDAGYNMSPADRAEFFYAGRQVGQTGTVDYQELSSYLEVAQSDLLSLFIETPLRAVSPQVAGSSAGIADMNVGFKAALLVGQDSYTTFQFRAYLPTGDDDRRLGTGNVSLEPGILQTLRLTDCLLMENEFKTWVPLTSDAFAGTILRYGVGLSYVDPNACPCQPTISPVVEVVGWSVLDGLETSNTGLVISAAGNTIINAKFGLRMSYTDHQLYAGFGQALTSQTWYEQVLRLEYRILF